jgi:hypothetical protein
MQDLDGTTSETYLGLRKNNRIDLKQSSEKACHQVSIYLSKDREYTLWYKQDAAVHVTNS